MKITFIGDIMLARMVGSKYAQQPYKIVSDEIVDNIVHSSDLIIANLESPLPDNHETEDHLQFDGNVAALNELKWIDLFSLANNHINDCGEQGMIDTINHLEEKEFGHNGLFVREYKPFIYQKDEEKIAVITLTDMMNIPFSNDSKFKVLRLGDDHIIDIIRQQKEKGNAVVLFAHVGMLFTRYPNPITRSFLHEYIDAGADCIVTCHSHCLGGMEYYKGKPIFHSIGDFVMDGNSYRRQQSCFLCLSMEKSTVVDWSITPTIINKRLETIIPKKRIERNMRNSFQFISTMLERYGEKESYLRLFKKKYKREIFFHSISTINFILNDRGVFGLFRLLFKRSSEVSRTMKWMSKDRSNDQRDDEAILPDRKKMKQEELFKEDRFEIGKARISITSPNDTETKIGKNIDNEYLVKSPGGVIFVANVRTVLLANQDIKYRYFFNNSLLTLPDGMPLVWMARLWGLKNVQRVCGPELFVSMLCNPKNGIKHFLIGDTQETLAKIEKKYVLEKETNKALIVGYYSPPFCDLDEYDYKMIADKINNSNADVVWTALRSPKQDLFNSRLFPYIDDKICIGVGAAFRFAIGDYRNPPAFFKKIGATGFFWRKINFQMLNLYLKYSFEILGWSFKIIFQRLKHAR